MAVGVERVNAHCYATHAGVHETCDALVSEERAVRADDDGRAALRGERGDVLEVVSEKWLAARENEERRPLELEDLFSDAATLRRRELAFGTLRGPRRDIAVRTLEVATPSEIPGDHVWNVVVARALIDPTLL
jgi:hypothetical protein